MQFREIKIDLEVNAAIENSRRSFAETENDILRRMLRVGSLGHVTPSLGERAPSARGSGVSRGRGNWAVEIRGERRPALNLILAYKDVLMALMSMSPDFAEEFAAEGGKSRKFIAKSPETLFLRSPHLASAHAQPLPGGWYFDSNLSEDQVAKRVRVAARIAGMRYGTELKILNNLKLV